MKKNINLIILSFLILVMFFVWSGVLKKPKRKNTFAKDVIPEQTIAKSSNEVAFFGERKVKKRKRSEFKNWGRDPFSLGIEITNLADLKLMGILWDENYPQAIINERIVKVNDMVENNKVIDIRKNSVILSDGKNKIELRLWSEPEAVDKK